MKEEIKDAEVIENSHNKGDDKMKKKKSKTIELNKKSIETGKSIT